MATATNEGVLDRATDGARAAETRGTRPPRLAFLGVGWIGRNRMQAVLRDGAAAAAVVADPSADARARAAADAPDALLVDSAEALLERADALDGVVVATPSAQHAEQAVAALERGLAVFCQKPLGRDAAEAARVVDAARSADRLLGVDMCYRRTRAGAAVAELVRSGALGRIRAVDLVFHNAYGPDKAWFYDAARAGGGCLMDLGIHLVDLLLWSLDEWTVEDVHARLYRGATVLVDRAEVEDLAHATLRLPGGATARLACSWNLHAGQDAVIEATFHGTDGAARMRNLCGSFYDFVAERMDGTRTERLVDPPDDWGGRPIRAWARRLATDAGYDPAAEEAVRVARVLDAIYACAS